MTRYAGGQVQCKCLVTSDANDWSSRMQTGGQVECNFPEEAYIEALRMTVLDFAQKDEASAILATWSTIMGTPQTS